MRQHRILVVIGILALALGVGYFLHRGATAGRPAPPSDTGITASAAQTAPETDGGKITAHKPATRRVAAATSSAPLPPPGTPLKDTYAELAARARSGDNAAAMRLVYDLQRCMHAKVVTPLIAASPMLQIATDQATSKESEERNRAVEKSLDYLDKMDSFCAGITPDQIDQRGTWLRMAATNGDAEAMVCYAMAPFDFGPKMMSDAWFTWAEQWRANAPQFAAQAFAAGQADVIALLRDAYSEGTQLPNMRLTDFRYGQLVNPDPMLALAYGLLYERVAPPGALNGASRFTQQASSKLTPNQVARAQAFADAAWPRFMAHAGQHDNILPCFKYINGASRQ
jgi:hypothetical protein